jgi:hypothetical protein
MADNRLGLLRRFYVLLTELESNIGGTRRLAEASGSSGWPRRGVYFFQETGELRTDSGAGPRIVRVGTHALRVGSGTSLWTRLAQHKGQVASGAGNYRGSIFRLIVGAALIRREGYAVQTWGVGSSATRPTSTAVRCGARARIRDNRTAIDSSEETTSEAVKSCRPIGG